jgi:hypothetical protein
MYLMGQNWYYYQVPFFDNGYAPGTQEIILKEAADRQEKRPIPPHLCAWGTALVRP